MARAKRRQMPQEAVDQVLIRSRRRCCLCFFLDATDQATRGQIARLSPEEEDRPENLVFLCLSHHAAFDSERRFTKDEVIAAREALAAHLEKGTDGRELLEHIRHNPRAIYDMSWSEFEAIIARLLAAEGYKVAGTTPQAKDGGRDIIAVARRDSGDDYVLVVECKRYSPKRRVGVDSVERLLKAGSSLGADKYQLVTTSTFSPAARELAKSYNMRLVDYSALRQWLEDYARKSHDTISDSHHSDRDDDNDAR